MQARQYALRPSCSLVLQHTREPRSYHGGVLGGRPPHRPLSPWFESRMSPKFKPLTVVLPCLFIWLLAFEVIEGLTGLQVAYLEAFSVPEAGLQFVRWVGWIPLASLGLWISERRGKSKQPAGAAMPAR